MRPLLQARSQLDPTVTMTMTMTMTVTAIADANHTITITVTVAAHTLHIPTAAARKPSG